MQLLGQADKNVRAPRHIPLLAIMLTLGLLATTLPAAEGISNVRVSQRAGTNLVDLYCDLASTATNHLVAVVVSTNGGLT